jgi:hypothetical protein
VRVIWPGFSVQFSLLRFFFPPRSAFFFCQINYMTKRVAYVSIRQSGWERERMKKKVSMVMENVLAGGEIVAFLGL